MSHVVSPIPDEYRHAIPMLAVSNAADALAFYQRAFAATEVLRLIEPGTGKIMHAEIRIGAAQIMVADHFPEHNRLPEELGGTPVMVHLFVEDVDALFENAVAAGAQVIRPLADQPTGNRNGKLRDPYGHVWLFQTRKQIVSHDPDDTVFDPVRRYFEARADRFSEPYRHIGEGKEWRELPSWADGYVAVPARVLEAGGFYFLNVLKRDNGSVYVFQADADGTPAFAVLATSDGSDAHLEVYGKDGVLLGAALLDGTGGHRSVVTWASLEAVRHRGGIEGFA